VARATATTAPREEVVVIWGNSSWDGHRLGAQFLAEAMAEHHVVVYVDPPISLTRVLARGRRALDVVRSPLVEQVAPRLVRVRTYGPPLLRRPGFRTVNDRLLRHQVHRAVDTLDREVRAVVSGYLDVHPFGCVQERWRIFRASDDFSAGAELGVPVRRAFAAQQRTADAADAVVCASLRLVEVWARLGHDPVLVPNGCDAEGLRGARALPRPAVIALPDPIVGYVGQLASRIDFDLLDAVADRGHSLLLVGGRRPDLVAARLDALVARPNVQWIDEVAYDQIPAILGSLAVGLVPYDAASDFNRASFPLKLLEYLAAGAAAVSTPLPAAAWLDTPLIRLAATPDEFAATVARALDTADDPSERAARYELAAGHSWASRAAAYVSLLDRLDAGADHDVDQVSGG
jgi:teichuronic acid biosynthesis glycosyltransferase TuaH